MIEYYIVYSIRTDKGSGVGRTSVTCSQPIDSMKRICEIEDSIFEDLRKKESGAENLFLTYWHQIKPTAAEAAA